MTISAVLALSLLTPSLGPPAARAAPAVSAADGSAWAVVRAGQLWLCWSPGPRCFERVELEAVDAGASSPAPDALDSLDGSLAADEAAPLEAPASTSTPASGLGRDASWRLGFDGPSLWIALDGQHWRVSEGQRRASAVEGVAPRRLERPRLHACGPRAEVPAFIGAALGWQSAPTCVAPLVVERCLAPARPRVRRPLPLRIRAGLQLDQTLAWSTRARRDAEGEARSTLIQRASLTLVAFVALEFDLGRRLGHELARSAARAGAPRGLRALPPVPAGPLAEPEQAALRELLCAAEVSP